MTDSFEAKIRLSRVTWAKDDEYDVQVTLSKRILLFGELELSPDVRSGTSMLDAPRNIVERFHSRSPSLPVVRLEVIWGLKHSSRTTNQSGKEVATENEVNQSL